jgi:hypothetical protein
MHRPSKKDNFYTKISKIRYENAIFVVDGHVRRTCGDSVAEEEREWLTTTGSF